MPRLRLRMAPRPGSYSTPTSCRTTCASPAARFASRAAIRFLRSARNCSRRSASDTTRASAPTASMPSSSPSRAGGFSGYDTSGGGCKAGGFLIMSSAAPWSGSWAVCLIVACTTAERIRRKLLVRAGAGGTAADSRRLHASEPARRSEQVCYRHDFFNIFDLWQLRVGVKLAIESLQRALDRVDTTEQVLLAARVFRQPSVVRLF